MISKMFCYILTVCLVCTSLATTSDGKKMPRNIKIFMCGDVMTGRGIDQVLAHPSDPLIHESYLKSARGYVKLAEAANGPIRQPVSFGYIWGDALAELNRAAPDVRLINLETSITASNHYWKGKGIHYRMNPQNIAGLTAADIDVCALANNHVLDWGYAGLRDTLESLQRASALAIRVEQRGERSRFSLLRLRVQGDVLHSQFFCLIVLKLVFNLLELEQLSG